MSKNITIKEDGTTRNFTAQKIKTNVTGGGTCIWVPEDEVQVTTKSITANGTYAASSDGKYGYSQVTVNVPGGAGGSPGGAGSSIVGTDTDGNDYLVEVEQDGTIEKTKLPVKIAITTQPTKQSYTDGETIDITGMVIVAYDIGTSPMQFVDLSEVTISPTTTEWQEEYYTNGNGVTARKIEYKPSTLERYWVVGIPGHPAGSTDYLTYYTAGEAFGERDGHPTTYGGEGAAVLLATRYNDENYLARISGDESANLYEYYDGERKEQVIYTGWNFSGGSSGRTSEVFTGQAFSDTYLTELTPESTSDPNGISVSEMIAGDCRQTITVSWPRPGDGKILSTTFQVEVAKPTQQSGT